MKKAIIKTGIVLVISTNYISEHDQQFGMKMET